MPNFLDSSNPVQVTLEQVERLRGDVQLAPNASIVFPVNAQGDLGSVLRVISDVLAYHGKNRLEIILVINNYASQSPPDEIDEYRALGLRVIAIPKIEFSGTVIIAARVLGIREAATDNVILFDADCRVPDPTSLIDWYVDQLERGVELAYTHVDYYNLPDKGISVAARMFVHHGSRWFRRNILRMPTCRGSNYAVHGPTMLKLFDQGLLENDFHVGPVFKASRARIKYSGDKSMTVYTSGRFFSGGWNELFRYVVWRMGYYLEYVGWIKERDPRKGAEGLRPRKGSE